MNSLSHTLIFLLLVAFPVWDAWEHRTLRRGGPGVKVRSYIRMILGLWAVSALLLALHPGWDFYQAPPGVLGGLGEAQARSAPLPIRALFLAFLGGLLAPVFLAALNRKLRERFLKAHDALDHLLPQTGHECWIWVGVALTAGVCEELIFRAFLIRYFQASPWSLPLLPALLLSSLVFGLVHTGQGWKGMAATSAVGVGLGVVYLSSGSLLYPVLIHTLVDLRPLAVAWMRRTPAEST